MSELTLGTSFTGARMVLHRDLWLTQVVFCTRDRQTARSLDLSRYCRPPNH